MQSILTRRHSDVAKGPSTVVLVSHSNPPSAETRTALKRRPTFLRQSEAISMIACVEISFDSLTGTSDRLARELGKAISAWGIATRVQSLAQFDDSQLTSSNSLSGFVHLCPPISPAHHLRAQQFHDWLEGKCMMSENRSFTRRSMSHAGLTRLAQWFQRITQIHPDVRPVPSFASNSLCGLKYAVFGVGDSKCRTFNAMGKFLHAKLRAIGATPFCRLAFGDVSQDLDSEFEKWMKTLVECLPSASQTTPDTTVLGECLHPTSLECEAGRSPTALTDHSDGMKREKNAHEIISRIETPRGNSRRKSSSRGSTHAAHWTLCQVLLVALEPVKVAQQGITFRARSKRDH